jgi:hypothetical protein
MLREPRWQPKRKASIESTFLVMDEFGYQFAMAAAPESTLIPLALRFEMAALLNSWSPAIMLAIGSLSLMLHRMQLMSGSVTVSATWPSDFDTTRNTTTNTFGVLKTLMHMAIGPTQQITAGSGDHTLQSSISIKTGRRIDMVTGFGFHLTVGLG